MVDLVIPHKNYLIPVEVKSGPVGSMRSLHQFVEASEHPFAVRIYEGKFSIEQHKTNSGKSFTLMNLPYFLGTKIHEYINYYLQE